MHSPNLCSSRSSGTWLGIMHSNNNNKLELNGCSPFCEWDSFESIGPSILGRKDGKILIQQRGSIFFIVFLFFARGICAVLAGSMQFATVPRYLCALLLCIENANKLLMCMRSWWVGWGAIFLRSEDFSSRLSRALCAVGVHIIGA